MLSATRLTTPPGPRPPTAADPVPATLDERTARILRQHAATSRLLGVDFVPAPPVTQEIRARFTTELEPVARPSDTSASAEQPASRQVETKPRARAEAPTNRAAASPTPSPTASPTASPAPKPALRPATKRPSSVEPYTPIEIPSGELKPKQAHSLLEEVRSRYEADAPHQYFPTDHHAIVFGEGDPCARLMFVGEAPGEQEDIEGRPFVGRSGQLLEKMIIAMGLSRKTVYIANVLKTRPPNNQTPTTEEAELCAPYLLDQIRVVQPEVIVTLGLPASRLLLGTKEPMRAMRGSFRQFPSITNEGIFAPLTESSSKAWSREPVPVMPTYHPAYLLRSYTPENRKKVWGDLQQVMDKLGLGTNA